MSFLSRRFRRGAPPVPPVLPAPVSVPISSTIPGPAEDLYRPLPTLPTHPNTHDLLFEQFADHTQARPRDFDLALVGDKESPRIRSRTEHASYMTIRWDLQAVEIYGLMYSKQPAAVERGLRIMVNWLRVRRLDGSVLDRLRQSALSRGNLATGELVSQISAVTLPAAPELQPRRLGVPGPPDDSGSASPV